MSEVFKNGYLLFDKSWFIESEFFKSLSHAEFRIMMYLLASVMRPNKRNPRYKRAETIAMLYQRNKLLVANVSTRTIAERCQVSRSTVCKALDNFYAVGAAIRISHGAKDGENNFYILGFDGSGSERDEYFFVDSIPIRAGEKMPDVVRERIESGYKETVFTKSARGWEILFGEERRLTQ
jgi:DNA-binding MarR family transcriptional regulator